MLTCLNIMLIVVSISVSVRIQHHLLLNAPKIVVLIPTYLGRNFFWL